jgi:hypothetical protein
MSSKTPFAIDWHDGTNWYNEMNCSSLEIALRIATSDLMQAMRRLPKDRHTLRIHGPNTYVTLNSDPPAGWVEVPT